MRKDILTETLDGIEMPVVAIFVDAKWFYRILRGERNYYISKTIPHICFQPYVNNYGDDN